MPTEKVPQPERELLQKIAQKLNSLNIRAKPFQGEIVSIGRDGMLLVGHDRIDANELDARLRKLGVPRSARLNVYEWLRSEGYSLDEPETEKFLDKYSESVARHRNLQQEERNNLKSFFGERPFLLTPVRVKKVSDDLLVKSFDELKLDKNSRNQVSGDLHDAGYEIVETKVLEEEPALFDPEPTPVVEPPPRAPAAEPSFVRLRSPRAVKVRETFGYWQLQIFLGTLAIVLLLVVAFRTLPRDVVLGLLLLMAVVAWLLTRPRVRKRNVPAQERRWYYLNTQSAARGLLAASLILLVLLLWPVLPDVKNSRLFVKANPPTTIVATPGKVTVVTPAPQTPTTTGVVLSPTLPARSISDSEIRNNFANLHSRVGDLEGKHHDLAAAVEENTNRIAEHSRQIAVLQRPRVRSSLWEKRTTIPLTPEQRRLLGKN